MTDAIFDPEAHQGRYDFWMRTPAPRKVYAILFTPRSGSSWLTSVLTKTRMMGTPGEWFNPTLMTSSSRSKGARNLEQFIETISRHEAHGGIFGFEITYYQMMAVFGDEASFIENFRNSTFFWLIRKDIVAQAVSLDKMVQTKVSHASNHDEGEIIASDSAYDYNGSRIKEWISHIRNAEKATENMIKTFSLRPIRLAYEPMMASGATEVARIFRNELGITDDIPPDLETDHRKIGTEKNNVFAERFRTDYPQFIKTLENERADMLAEFP
ncbi:hypothetical protein EYE42_03025 [Paracoccus subflavus]|uniref:Sulphotransferase Stf0 domain-containing protein n=1 Tax=Paracoccus subflavus TaxID=2528244 RepID=A0A4V2JCV4_9RHOB|nr:Stf0 family sulfotransferase [Paracoccus subflavus]TBN44101.1 hypothetical protein EYE42_03025 [Paracoccus subflavus]